MEQIKRFLHVAKLKNFDKTLTEWDFGNKVFILEKEKGQ